MLKREILLATALTGLMGIANTGWAGEISVEDAWVRSAPPTVTVMAGYMTLHNHSGKAVKLTSVTSPSFESVELHRTTMHGGMMHMKPVKVLIIKANDTVRLEPNGYHLMLNNPKQKISSGDTIHFTLNFDGTTEQVDAVVKEGNGEGESASHGHHH